MSGVIPITALERDLIEGGLSACTCMTKSGETKHHDRLCTYRLHTDARMKIRDLTEQLEAAKNNYDHHESFDEGFKVGVASIHQQLEAVETIVDNTVKINIDNYTQDQVEEQNQALIDIHALLLAALPQEVDKDE